MTSFPALSGGDDEVVRSALYGIFANLNTTITTIRTTNDFVRKFHTTCSASIMYFCVHFKIR
jgi:hypothetical protein